jgi:tripartite-type tricarboxylate transporter receptor subunit TctC
MKRRTFVGMAASAVVLPALPVSAQAYPWRPERPVTIIVPWAAGGSTDQMARVVAAELESELGQRFVVVNQPGASGSIGTRNALEAARDGYTRAAGAAVDLGT